MVLAVGCGGGDWLGLVGVGGTLLGPEGSGFLVLLGFVYWGCGGFGFFGGCLADAAWKGFAGFRVCFLRTV